jgi:hypothetical protein
MNHPRNQEADEMLSWDDYHKEEAAPARAAKSINAAALGVNVPMPSEPASAPVRNQRSESGTGG